ncbi:hypothetical protein G6F56_008684 [Rhizopus delemar]|nr:hypothetical protein G6F56_008684 [Rhizopus delemar]
MVTTLFSKKMAHPVILVDMLGGRKNKACIKGFDFWPAQSPDLNPIENLWYVLVKRIGKRRHQVNNLEGLEVVIYEERANLDYDICVKLCRSILEDVMPLKEH